MDRVKEGDQEGEKDHPPLEDQPPDLAGQQPDEQGIERVENGVDQVIAERIQLAEMIVERKGEIDHRARRVVALEGDEIFVQ